MRYFFLTFIVALTASMMSVTARRPTCSQLDGYCVKNSDCCDSSNTCGANQCVQADEDIPP
ncbi:uncharacterized protein BJ212DRAFT_1396751 [Suillus subaureus]|uniref:Uncharacterized protein n=1 Tax=Suillus subaureus TaxID=48587 RepID=A0A9P7DTW5_9AGAM|nr:uncharacterized protein BJ212DRAFT_1396751 [Suillus subaureus]KAG1803068.1 hypothetical protein BJ212DRAFT_1396751 [Suillus subaureus]